MADQSQHVGTTIDGHIARVELHRPPVNALNGELVGELTSVAAQLAAKSDVWIVVVTSGEKAFCAGADLKERVGVPDSEVLTTVERIRAMTDAWFDLPQPLIMGVNGAALGGGLEFVLAGDILAASELATLGFPEVGLGIIPGAGGMPRIGRRASWGVAQKWVLTGERFSALQAFEDGVVDYVFPAATFNEQLQELVKKISAHAPMALRQAKKALRQHMAAAVGNEAAVDRDSYAPLVSSRDRKEALKAFVEKRPPKWQGS